MPITIIDIAWGTAQGIFAGFYVLFLARKLSDMDSGFTEKAKRFLKKNKGLISRPASGSVSRRAGAWASEPPG